MTNALDRLPRGARVAILRLRSLGDCVLTTPALQLLTEHRPDLRVGVVVENRFRAIFEGHPALELMPPEYGALVQFRPDLAINFHGGTRSVALTAASLAPLRAGFGHYRLSGAYNIRIPTAQEILGADRLVHTAEHLASAMFYLGVPLREIPRARLYTTPQRHSRRYAILHPTASAPQKAWPADRFRKLAEHIVVQFDLEPVFIGGPGEDLSCFSAFRTVCGALEESKQWLAGADLFVGNDSGPAHIAAAFGIPLVVLFGPSDPRIWGPWKTPGRVLTGPSGISSIPVMDVLSALIELRAQVRS